MTRKLLGMTAIGADRLHLAWCSSSEGQRFARIAEEVTNSVKALGKFNPEDLKLELDAAGMTLENETVRWLVGKELTLTEKGDVYGRKWDKDRFESILSTVLKKEYHKNLIYLALKEGFTSVRDIGGRTGLDLQNISFLLSDMEKTSRIKFKGYENCIPVFESL